MACRLQDPYASSNGTTRAVRTTGLPRGILEHLLRLSHDLIPQVCDTGDGMPPGPTKSSQAGSQQPSPPAQLDSMLTATRKGPCLSGGCIDSPSQKRSTLEPLKLRGYLALRIGTGCRKCYDGRDSVTPYESTTLVCNIHPIGGKSRHTTRLAGFFRSCSSARLAEHLSRRSMLR